MDKSLEQSKEQLSPIDEAKKAPIIEILLRNLQDRGFQFCSENASYNQDGTITFFICFRIPLEEHGFINVSRKYIVDPNKDYEERLVDINSVFAVVDGKMYIYPQFFKNLRLNAQIPGDLRDESAFQHMVLGILLDPFYRDETQRESALRGLLAPLPAEKIIQSPGATPLI